MKELGKVFTSISASFALIPGMTILITELGVPPGASKIVFGTIIESVCLLILLTLWINKERIRQLTVSGITRNTIVISCLFVVLLATYFFLYGYYVEEIPHTGDLLFPVWSNGELAEGLQMYGNRMKLVETWGRDDVFKVIQSSSPVAVQVTITLFLLTYTGVFVTLTTGFGILGIKVTTMKQKEPPLNESR